jgi:hypothetical protein
MSDAQSPLNSSQKNYENRVSDAFDACGEFVFTVFSAHACVPSLGIVAGSESSAHKKFAKDIQ